MKRVLLVTAFMTLCCAAFSQSYNIKVSESIPQAAAKVLESRFSKMLQDAGLTLADDGQPLGISAIVKESSKTSGSISQSVIVLDVVASASGKKAVFSVRGVGADSDDAWQRAARQILPGSRDAKSFIDSLKKTSSEYQ